MLYQHAYWGERTGLRIKEKSALDRTTEHHPRRPYTIDRWRLEEHEATRPTYAVHASSSKPYHDHPLPSQSPGNPKQSIESSEKTVSSRIDLRVAMVESNQSSRMKLTFPADHLLHLIYYNVFRGLILNKAILERLTIHFVPDGEHPKVFNINSLFPGYSAVIPAQPTLPACLHPTQLQTKIVHSTWIDLFPFPKMRENLIRWEAWFDHSDFINDMIGNLIDRESYSLPWASQRPPIVKRPVQLNGDDEFTSSRKGLIIWGEPYKPESWEATPGFLQKWSWAVEDCEELIRSSNCWRMTRGEDPIQFSVAGKKW